MWKRVIAAGVGMILVVVACGSGGLTEGQKLFCRGEDADDIEAAAVALNLDLEPIRLAAVDLRDEVWEETGDAQAAGDAAYGLLESDPDYIRVCNALSEKHRRDLGQ